MMILSREKDIKHTMGTCVINRWSPSTAVHEQYGDLQYQGYHSGCIEFYEFEPAVPAC